MDMDILHERAAGIDIAKRGATVCVRKPGGSEQGFTSTVTSWEATTDRILELREFLVGQKVTVVMMEATSDYWKPFYYLLEEDLPVMLVNAKAARNIPRRKTDVADAVWLARLAAHGLLRASFVPPEPIRELRDLTRSRAIAVRDRTREIQRLEKFLESSGIKLSSVASNLTGASGRAMLDALITGERDPEVLACMAKGKLRNKIPELTDALKGRFKDHHAFMVGLHLEQIDAHTRMIDALTERIEASMRPFRCAREALMTIPGIAELTADVIIAETGADMSVFPDAAHLASWAGICPGNNESAGKVKSTKIPPGNKYLKAALGTAAMVAVRDQNSYLGARYRRIKTRRGAQRALVAIEHSILTAIWHMLANGECYKEPDEDRYVRTNQVKTTNRAIKQLRQLGYDVTLAPTSAA